MGLLGNFIEKRFLKPGREMKASQFQELHPRPGGVVFLGDSITEGGLWHEWFPDVAVVNRGIDGDTTAGVLARLDSALTGPPAALFLLIGTNDLTMRAKPEEIAARVENIIDAIHEAAPDTRVVLQSVMPRNTRFHAKLRTLNDMYRRVAVERDVEFIDLWPALSTNDGTLRPEFTLDDLHLGGAGYRAWVGVLRPHVDRLVNGAGQA